MSSIVALDFLAKAIVIKTLILGITRSPKLTHTSVDSGIHRFNVSDIQWPLLGDERMLLVRPLTSPLQAVEFALSLGPLDVNSGHSFNGAPDFQLGSLINSCPSTDLQFDGFYSGTRLNVILCNVHFDGWILGRPRRFVTFIFIGKNIFVSSSCFFTKKKKKKD